MKRDSGKPQGGIRRKWERITGGKIKSDEPGTTQLPRSQKKPEVVKEAQKYARGQTRGNYNEMQVPSRGNGIPSVMYARIERTKLSKTSEGFPENTGSVIGKGDGALSRGRGA